ncbi:hypothetical protein SteCoe_25544 [Stentor coeruleus]|uniref:Uncharacterized protein n=1 Tax=Stentor coeruleus TaxID=5963 RepID=A0A1R2BF02_9CILI|nr:hypothetical protein SteCoe_25544 [Stentor coeruleus]
MSETAIEEKIRKIRQDLYNFNIGEQSSLDLYLAENHELKFSELESPYRLSSPENKRTSLKNSQSPENIKSPERLKSSQKFLPKNFDSTANYKEFTISKELNFAQSQKEGDLMKLNQELIESLAQEKEKYLRIIAEKDEKIAFFNQRLKRAESDLNVLKQGYPGIESLKSSAHEFLTKTEDLDIEKSNLIKENLYLKSQISQLEKDHQSKSSTIIDENTKLKSEKSRYIRKYDEIKKENEILYKTLQDYKCNRNSSTSCSPKKSISPGHYRKISLKDFNKKNPFSDDEKTERKNRSPSVKKTGYPPRSKSREKNYEIGHLTSCKIVKELMSLYSIDSPALVISLVKSSLQDSQNLQIYKDFTTNIQKIITSNSPPNTFKTPPGLKTSIKWVKRLIKEYLALKLQGLSQNEKKILDVLRAGLNTHNNEDIPRAISKLLVENERLLVILSKVKKAFKLGHNISLEGLEKEINARI